MKTSVTLFLLLCLTVGKISTSSDGLDIQLTINRFKDCDDYYEFLGITSSATSEEIKKAYHARAKLVHPDKGHCKDDVLFKKLKNIKDTLSDSKKKREYDKERMRAMQRKVVIPKPEPIWIDWIIDRPNFSNVIETTKKAIFFYCVMRGSHKITLADMCFATATVPLIVLFGRVYGRKVEKTLFDKKVNVNLLPKQHNLMGKLSLFTARHPNIMGMAIATTEIVAIYFASFLVKKGVQVFW